MPYQLVRDTISRDTVQALRQLLELAERGDLTVEVGLAGRRDADHGDNGRDADRDTESDNDWNHGQFR